MTKTFRGKAHGRMIELEEDLDVTDGEEVEVQVKYRSKTRRPGEGLLRTEGALADDQEWDGIMAEIHLAHNKSAGLRSQI